MRTIGSITVFAFTCGVVAAAGCGGSGGSSSSSNTNGGGQTTNGASNGTAGGNGVLNGVTNGVLSGGGDGGGNAASSSNGGGGSASSGSFDFGPLDHVTSDPYTGLLVEIDAVEGHEPDERALTRLENRIESLASEGHLGKPDGIRIVMDETLPETGADTVHSFDDLRALSRQHRSIMPRDGESSIYMMYTDGRYEEDGEETSVLGFAYEGSWIVMLKDNIERSCDNSPVLALPALVGAADQVCTIAEASVLVHEMGHLFGLVNNGIDMVQDHQDEEHGAHDDNDACIMHWLIERSDAVDIVAERFRNGNEAVPPFDAACQADLDAAQGD